MKRSAVITGTGARAAEISAPSERSRGVLPGSALGWGLRPFPFAWRASTLSGPRARPCCYQLRADVGSIHVWGADGETVRAGAFVSTPTAMQYAKATKCLPDRENCGGPGSGDSVAKEADGGCDWALLDILQLRRNYLAWRSRRCFSFHAGYPKAFVLVRRAQWTGLPVGLTGLVCSAWSYPATGDGLQVVTEERCSRPRGLQNERACRPATRPRRVARV